MRNLVVLPFCEEEWPAELAGRSPRSGRNKNAIICDWAYFLVNPFNGNGKGRSLILA